MQYLTLIPAYGRDYKSKADLLKDWEDDKDFLVADMFHPYDGKPVNKSQVPAGTQVNIRYANMRKLTTFKL